MLLCLFAAKWTHGEAHLDLLLPEMDLASQLLPGAHVWVLGLLEKALQSLQLLVGEDGAVPPLPAAVQLVEELQLVARQAAHVHVGHHLVRNRGDEHRARVVVAWCGGRGGRRIGLEGSSCQEWKHA